MGLADDLTGLLTYLDSNIFIYFLEGHADYAEPLTALFDRIGSGALQAVTSQLTLAEVLVKPLRDQNSALYAQCLLFIRSREGLRVSPIDQHCLLEAARLRAGSGFRLPDAIHIAAATTAGCQSFLTNDRRLGACRGLRVVYLDHYAAT